MPGYKGHITGGLVTGGLVLAATALTGVMHSGGLSEDASLLQTVANIGLQMPGILLFCLLGALFPDVDTDSKGQNLFYSFFVVVDAVLIYRKAYQLAAWMGLFSMLPALGHHRGWTHSWLAMPLVGVPIIFVPVMLFGKEHMASYLPIYIAFTLGYCSHLVLDRVF